MTVVVRSIVNDPDSTQFCASTLKYHAAGKHDSPTSHFKVTLVTGSTSPVLGLKW